MKIRLLRVALVYSLYLLLILYLLRFVNLRIQNLNNIINYLY